MPEARQQGGSEATSTLGHVLFLAVFTFYWITLTPFVDLTGAAAVDPVAGNSNALNQLVAILLFGSLTLFFLTHRRGVSILGHVWILALILLWAIFTSATALHPDLAIKRTILVMMIVCNAAIVLVLPRTVEDFARLSAIVLFAMLAMCYFGVAFRPTLAIHQASEIREPMHAGLWRGLFSHKNSAAAAMVLAVIFGLFIARSWSRLAGWAIVVLAAFFLSQTGGKTSTLVLPAILILGWIIERFPALRYPVILGGLGSFNLLAVGSAVSEPIRDWVRGLGVDATFSDRADIWRFAFEAISERPILGHGLQSFWQTDNLVYSGSTVETWAAAAFNGHNAYIDTVVELGLPGLLLTLIWLIFLPLRDYGRAQQSDNNPALTRLFMRIWLYAVLLSCLETIYFQGGGALWFCLLVSVFGLRLQSSAQLVPARYRQPSAFLEARHA
ncbi:O-antigen ligase [Devosia crocina]|uniref:O-antigen ligase n=1 Tax=Devosia crocina TaxID=429728 RepID=A0A1I7NRB9_9HYPH|nr:O-antigen ligase [Devosia crocina]SFV37216.1 O-antigen ligase [Devosia crocina]